MLASRRTLLRSALLVPVGVAGVSAGSVLRAPSAAADSVRGGPITRAEIIARAQFWVDHQPGGYNQGAYSPGPGDSYRYRRDCSGYVAMAWHLDDNPWTGTLPSYSDAIPRSELRPGDILNDAVNHVFIFHRWLDDRGGFGYYSFGSTPVRYLRANINDARLDSWPNGNFVARRYRKVVDEPVGRPAMPYESGRIVAGRSADGRLEAYAAGSDGVWHAWQLRPNGQWSPWQNTGGPARAELAIVPNKDGRMEVFALNGDVLSHRWQTAVNGGWSGWSTFGTGGHDLAAGANADGRIEVAASNRSGVFHRWQTTPGAWSAWEGTAAGDNGPADARLEMAMSADGRLEIFALSDDRFGHLFQTRASGPWSAWEAFGTGGHDLSVEHNVDGRLEVFASNPNGIFRRWQTGRDTWSEWRGTGGLANARLATERTPDGRIEAFAINGSAAQHAWQESVNGEFSAWAGFGTGGTEINASKNADGRIDVFASSSAGVYHKWQTGPATWSGWEWLASNAGPGQS